MERGTKEGKRWSRVGKRAEGPLNGGYAVGRGGFLRRWVEMEGQGFRERI